MVRAPFRIFLPLLLLLIASCAEPAPRDPRVEEWKEVLALKKQTAPGSLQDRQKHADALVAFLKKYPDHQRARSVYKELQLERARDLARKGAYSAAAAICRQLLKSFPDAADVQQELRAIAERQVVTSEEFSLIEKGMAEARVLELLGPPPTGWRRSSRKGATPLESLFYRNSEGGVAAIHCERGKVFALDWNSSAGVR